VAGPLADSRTAGSACAPLDTEPLPSWALSGFSDPTATWPFGRSASGDLVGIVFTDPLQAAASAQDPQNKTLWVTRTPPQATDLLKTTAQPENTDQLTEVDLHEPPGLSIVDLPTPGCGVMQLRWVRTPTPLPCDTGPAEPIGTSRPRLAGEPAHLRRAGAPPHDHHVGAPTGSVAPSPVSAP
jgi:hypothetical protein